MSASYPQVYNSLQPHEILTIKRRIKPLITRILSVSDPISLHKLKRIKRVMALTEKTKFKTYLSRYQGLPSSHISTKRYAKQLTIGLDLYNQRYEILSRLLK